MSSAGAVPVGGGCACGAAEEATRYCARCGRSRGRTVKPATWRALVALGAWVLVTTGVWMMERRPALAATSSEAVSPSPTTMVSPPAAVSVDANAQSGIASGRAPNPNVAPPRERVAPPEPTARARPPANAGALTSAAKATKPWREAFGKYADGAPATGWGEALRIVKGGDGRNYLSSNTPGQHRIVRRIELGDHFELSFDWTSFDARENGRVAPWVRIPITFEDAKGRRLSVECGNWGLLLPGRSVVDFNERSINTFRMVRQGNDYRFFNNGSLLANLSTAGYGPFVAFELVLPVTARREGQRFTNFAVSPLGGPVRR